MYCDKDWKKFKDKLAIPLGTEGKDEHKVIGLRVAFPNILVVGRSKNEKLNFFHCAIANILRQSNPKPVAKLENAKLVLIGKKDSEFSMYEGLSCLKFPSLSDSEDARDAILWCITEMARRGKLGIKSREDFNEYNKKHQKKLPTFLVFIDDLGWVLKTHPMFAKGFELINKTSAWLGFYFIIRVSNSAKNIPKEILDRFFMRICFNSTIADSKLVVGSPGAESLKRGQLLFSYAKSDEKPMHLQGYQITKNEIRETVRILKELELADGAGKW